MTAGTIFLMWLGEQIDEYGIGNGISLIIMAGIVARMPGAGSAAVRARQFKRSASRWAAAAAGRRHREADRAGRAVRRRWSSASSPSPRASGAFPTQSAKHVRGRRVYGGTRQFLPLRVNQAGVMPVIFASSLLMFPMFLFSCIGNGRLRRWLGLAALGRRRSQRQRLHLQRLLHRC